MDSYSLAAREIIKAQQAIIGPLAVDQAKLVGGLQIQDNSDVVITGNPKQILSELVERYAAFFGQASIEVCRDAVREINPSIPPESLPENLA